MKQLIGKEIDIKASKRYIEHVRDHAMTDIYDALVELITNADDSYGRNYRDKNQRRNGGDILIEHCEKRMGKPSFIIVRDKAEGMDSETMQRCLGKIGDHLAREGDRGYMGRGAKDCTALGDLTYESIKDDRYYKCRITNSLTYILEANQKATKEHREKLGVKRGNGTSVTLKLLPEKPIPKLKSLIESLPWHYALRDILSENSESAIKIRKADDDSFKTEKLVYHQPEGDIVVDEVFDVPDYPDAKAHLVIKRAPEPLPESKNRFEKFGVVIKGGRAIHECTLFSDEFKKDPYAHRYFGSLECCYIDQLMIEYEHFREKKQTHPDKNPRLVIDPNRRFGLDRAHPFVDALFQIPSERLRVLVAKDREKRESQRREISNSETRSRLERLAKFAGKFLREQLDDFEQFGEGDEYEEDSFSKKGVSIYPTYLNVYVGNERDLTLYVKKGFIRDEKIPVNIEVDNIKAIKIHQNPIFLHAHKKKEDRLIGNFKIKGLEPAKDVLLTIKCNSLPEEQALVQVIEKGVDEHIFGYPLEFERPDYKIYQGKNKKIRIFAKYPDVVAKETEVKVYSEDHQKAFVRGVCTLYPVSDSNYAVGDVTVEGRKLKSKTNIIAEVHGRRAEASVKIVDKVEREPNIPLRFEIRDEDYGNFRTRWAEAEGKPNLLLISSRHDSIARYLGSAEENYPGQSTAWFRVLLAEIIAESVCRKALILEATNHPYDFPWADLKKPVVIAEDVLSHIQQRMRNFVADAHSIMLNKSEIKYN